MILNSNLKITEVLKEDFIDAVVIGEGEVSFKNLCDCISGNKDLSSVKGIAYRSNGKIQINSPEELIKKLDDILFPAYYLFPDLDRYSSSEVVESYNPGQTSR